jgi:hypothetical protein
MRKFVGFPLSAWAFALRTWAAMMLALYVAFWLQLENGYIAAFTVGILSLPTRGQAYQKALYQLLMTVVGVAASIVIEFPNCFLCCSKKFLHAVLRRSRNLTWNASVVERTSLSTDRRFLSVLGLKMKRPWSSWVRMIPVRQGASGRARSEP